MGPWYSDRLLLGRVRAEGFKALRFAEWWLAACECARACVCVFCVCVGWADGAWAPAPWQSLCGAATVVEAVCSNVCVCVCVCVHACVLGCRYGKWGKAVRQGLSCLCQGLSRLLPGPQLSLSGLQLSLPGPQSSLPPPGPQLFLPGKALAACVDPEPHLCGQTSHMHASHVHAHGTPTWLLHTDFMSGLHAQNKIACTSRPAQMLSRPAHSANMHIEPTACMSAVHTGAAYLCLFAAAAAGGEAQLQAALPRHKCFVADQQELAACLFAAAAGGGAQPQAALPRHIRAGHDQQQLKAD